MSAQIRLQKEYAGLQKEPIPYALAVPDPNNWLEWHFVIHGLTECFKDGYYYGKVTFPASYPHAPPSMKIMTPNGRFSPNTNICTTMSSFHPESWTPAWNIRTIIIGLISFMLSREGASGTCSSSNQQKVAYAKESKAWNLNDPTFVSIFSPYFDVLFKEEPVVVRPKTSNLIKKTVKKYYIPVVLAGLLLGIYLIKLK